MGTKEKNFYPKIVQAKGGIKCWRGRNGHERQRDQLGLRDRTTCSLVVTELFVCTCHIPLAPLVNSLHIRTMSNPCMYYGPLLSSHYWGHSSVFHTASA